MKTPVSSNVTLKSILPCVLGFGLSCLEPVPHGVFVAEVAEGAEFRLREIGVVFAWVDVGYGAACEGGGEDFSLGGHEVVAEEGDEGVESWVRIVCQSVYSFRDLVLLRMKVRFGF